MKRGKYETIEVQLQTGGLIEVMTENDAYKYLGYEQARNIKHFEIKNALRKEYMTRMRK